MTIFLPSKHPKIVTGPLNGCDIVWIRLCPLEYMLKVRTKLLVKLRFGNFLIFFKFLFTWLYVIIMSRTRFIVNLHSKTTQKSLQISRNRAAWTKFTFSAFDKFDLYVTYSELPGMFCFLKFCNISNLFIWILNCS